MQDTIQMLRSFLSDGLVDDVIANCALNDPAHKIDHVIGVVKHADVIVKAFADELLEHRRLILAGAFMHDAMCHVDRKNHHILGAEYTYTMLERWEPQFNVYERMAAAQAVLEHRASWPGKRVSIISEAVAAADRGPIECISYIKRALRYRTGALNFDAKMLTEDMKFSLVFDSVKHIKEKFGTGGYAYAQMSQFTERLYADNIKQMCHDLDQQPEKLVEIGMEKFNEWIK